jgi:hypothetical protein
MSICRSRPLPEFTKRCGMPVQRGAAARLGVDEDQRDAGAAVLLALELAAHGELLEVDQVGLAHLPTP